MDCEIDRVLNYVSCYSSLMDTEEDADVRFTRLDDEVRAALPSDRWTGKETEPGIDSIRSYAYEDVKSEAHIDIDIMTRKSATGPDFYMITIFAWTY
jgi:hypothetical protein